MKILLVTHIFPPAIDGGSRVIYKLGEYLSQKHQIMCLTSNCTSTDDFVNPKSVDLSLIGHRPSYIGHRISAIGHRISIIRLPVYKTLRRPFKLLFLFLPKNSYFRHLLEVFQKGPVFKVLPLLKALIAIKQFHPDLIITGPLPTTIVLFANFIRFILNLNLQSTIYDRRSKLLINASFHQSDADFYKKPLLNILKDADHIWSLTTYEKHFFINTLKINPDKIHVVGNGVDKNLILNSDKIKFPKNPNLLFVGSFAAHKGVETLIDSFSKLSAQFPSLTLTLAGQKTLHFHEIQKKIKLLDPLVKSKIKLVFNFPQNNLQSLIDQSTILVLPSSQESFGLVLIESMARGKPVVCSNIPPLAELIKITGGGLTFKTGSSTDLFNKITCLLNDNQLSAKLGLQGLDIVKNRFTWDKIGKTLCQKVLS